MNESSIEYQIAHLSVAIICIAGDAMIITIFNHPIRFQIITEKLYLRNKSSRVSMSSL